MRRVAVVPLLGRVRRGVVAPFLGRVRRAGRRSLATPLLLSGAIVVGLLGYGHGVQKERRSAREALERRVGELAARVEREISSIAEELHQLALFVALRPDITLHDFQQLARTPVVVYPALLACEWVPRIPADERGTHEARARAEGLAGYAVRPLVDPPPSPPHRRDYYPVAYVMPLEGNRAALGVDLSSEPLREAALRQAAATDRVVFTPPVRLVQDPDARGSLLAVVAVRSRPERDPFPAAALAGGLDNPVRGFVLFVVRADGLLGRLAPGARSLLDNDLEFRLTDVRPEAQGAVLEESAGWARPVTAGPTLRRKIDAAGIRWTLAARPTAAFLARHTSRQPAVLAVLLFLSFGSAGALLLFTAGRARAAAMREQGRLTRVVLDHVNEGVVVAGADGRFLLFNEQAERILGLGVMQMNPAQWSATYGCYRSAALEPYPSQDLPLARALRGEASQEEEVFIRNPNLPDGVWISINGAPVTGLAGDERGAVVTFRDVTERMRQQETVRRLSSAVEQTADSIFITNREGIIEYVNHGFEVATGYSASEVLGQTPRLLKSGRYGRSHYEELWRTILSGSVWRATTVNRRKNGDEYHAEQTITPLRQPDGRVTHFVSVVKDVTERIRRQEREIEMAHAARVQQRLYPQAPPALRNFDVAGGVFPAALTGGDYLDYVPMPGEAIGLTVGDVCGHGLASAFIMTETRAYLRPLANCEADPGAVLSRLNPFLYADLDGRDYVTLCLVRLDPATGRLCHASAGHPPAIVLSAEGRVKATLDATGHPLGMFESSKYTSVVTPPLVAGDLLLLVTDGVTEAEARDERVLGMDGLLEVVRGCRGESAAAIVAHVREAAGRCMGEGAEQKDDLTILVCKAV